MNSVKKKMTGLIACGILAASFSYVKLCKDISEMPASADSITGGAAISMEDAEDEEFANIVDIEIIDLSLPNSKNKIKEYIRQINQGKTYVEIIGTGERIILVVRNK